MAIKTQDVTLTLQAGGTAVPILRGITLGVPPGERLAILGASGSGKSSFLSLLGGLEKASSGSIEIVGNPLDNLDEDALARLRRQHIGIIPQAFHLLPRLTALENVLLPLELIGKPDAPKQAADALAAVGLAARLKHFPAELSGGEQQRVAIARALVTGAKVILADEPTGNLDEKTGKAVMELLLERVVAAGATLVVVTHDQQLAQQCDRTLYMHAGRLSAQPADSA